MAILGGTNDFSNYLSFTSGYSSCKDKFLSVLDNIVWYNGLGEIISSWETKIPDMTGFITPDYRDKNYDVETVTQLEFIWMLSVLLYGEYGTSPRSGWIQDITEFRTFIHSITKTYRENEGGE